MEIRLTFSEFMNNLSNRAIPLEDLASYLELDPDSAVPKLRFRQDALLDSPSKGFDIDTYVYDMLQEFDEREYISEEEFRFIGKKKIVAEGDSWMNLPWFMGWKSIGDTLKSRNNYKVRNIGKWGHTIKEMVERKEYMEVIDKKNPDFFVFSGGGNDIQDKLKIGGIIKEYEPGLPAEGYLTQDGKTAISEIEDRYRILLAEVTAAFPDLKIFTHSYDFPRPLLGKGKFLGQYLRERNIPDELMSPILDNVVRKLDASINKVVDDFYAATHVDLLGATESYIWRNDFHPKNDGFNEIAIIFENAMK